MTWHQVFFRMKLILAGKWLHLKRTLDNTKKAYLLVTLAILMIISAFLLKDMIISPILLISSIIVIGLATWVRELHIIEPDFEQIKVRHLNSFTIANETTINITNAMINMIEAAKATRTTKKPTLLLTEDLLAINESLIRRKE